MESLELTPTLIPSLITMTLSTRILGVYQFLIQLCAFQIRQFTSLFPFNVCFSSVLKSIPSRVTLLMMSPPPLCPLPSNPTLQITVSLAQGYERTPSSPKPRFKSYAYTQAAYVTTSDPTRSPLPSQVCQHLLSVLQTKEFPHPR